LSKVEEEVVWRCDNLQCPAQVQRAILHFGSRGAMNIEHVGPALVDALLEAGLIRNAADLYGLKQKDLEPLERMAEKSAVRVIESIAESKARGLDRLLFGLGIRFIGKTTALALARHFQSLDRLQEATEEELLAAPDVGERMAKSLQDHFRNSQNRKLLERLRKAGVKTDYEAAAGSQPLLGQTWVITGTLPTWSRDEARDILIRAGAKVSDSVSKKTSALLVGDSAGSKLDKAQKFGVKTLGEEEVKAMLGMA
jgi:DNA ligase (NAD+)